MRIARLRNAFLAAFLLPFLATAANGQRTRSSNSTSHVPTNILLQIIRADEMLTRTLDRVEEASDMVHKTVVSPVRQLSGLVQGLTAGLEFLIGNRGRRNGGRRESRRSVPQDEMFI